MKNFKDEAEFVQLPKKIIAYNRKNGEYLFPEMSDKLYKGKDISIPLVMDKEWWQPTLQDFTKNPHEIKQMFRGKLMTLKIKDYWKKGRIGVTTQIKSFNDDSEGVIFADPDLVDIAKQLKENLRHPIARSGFHAIDFLNSIEGITAKLYRIEAQDILTEINGERIPYCEFVINSHFALAELYMIFSGDYLKDVEKIAIATKGKRFEMQRRLRAVTDNKHGQSDSVVMPWRLRINGLSYRVKITINDTCALHGVASYRDICETVGIPTPNKDLMKNDITRMHLKYFESPEDFDAYALGDLKVDNILINNAELFKKVWESLEILEYYQPPRRTIGATVRDIFAALIFKEFKISPDDKKGQKELLEKICFKGTAEYLKTQTNTTACLLGKVQGGTCRNNQPTITAIKNTALVDIDISSCYGEGQRNQIYPFGSPMIEDFEQSSKINKYLTLREWLNARKWGKKDCELVPGVWHARVCTKEIWSNDILSYALLKNPQDVIASWFGFKLADIAKMPTDSDLQNVPDDAYLDVKTGTPKIFNYQVINGLIAHNVIQWIENVCTPTQRNELLDNLYVHSAMYYPAYDRVDTPEELLERLSQHKGVNKTNSNKRKGGSRKTKITEECTTWYGVNLGEFFIDDLLAYRKIHQKENPDGTKNSLNTLFKLVTNTSYGDLVSPYFKTGNVVAGNNITERARAMCWYTEKGLNGTMSITDGTPFDLNKVVYPLETRKVTALSVTNLHREKYPTRQRKIKLAPLDNCEKIELSWQKVFIKNEKTGEDEPKDLAVLTLHKNSEITTLAPYEQYDPVKKKNYWVEPAKDWVNQKTLEHLQNLFEVDVLQSPTTRLKVKNNNGIPEKSYIPKKGQFEFEMKAFYDSGFFHGSANYNLVGKGGNNLAVRSYEKKTNHDAVKIENDDFIFTDFYDKQTPAHLFMSNLSEPHKVTRSKVFIKPAILKLNESKKNASRWKGVGRKAGDTIQKSGLLREFSLSQFTFQSLEQYRNIEKEVASNKRKYSQSYEGYFINPDGTLDFQRMINEIDKAISEGAMSLKTIFDKSRHKTGVKGEHPEKNTLDFVRENLLRPDAIDECEDFFETSTILCDEEGGVYIGSIDVDDEYIYCGDAIEPIDDSWLDEFEYNPE
jgi:hypothetical protein